MKITINSRKMTPTEEFRKRAEKKLAKLDRFFDSEAEAAVTVTGFKDKETVEITIRSKGLVFRSEKTTLNMKDSLEAVVDSLTAQIVKNKDKLISKYNTSFDELGSLPEESTEEYNVIRRKRFQIKPMSVEEAILEMNLSDHQFFLFRNNSDGEINLVYRRRNGDYGLIEPEAL